MRRLKWDLLHRQRSSPLLPRCPERTRRSDTDIRRRRRRGAPRRQRPAGPGRVPLEPDSIIVGDLVELAVSHLGDARARREGGVPRLHSVGRAAPLRPEPADARDRGVVAPPPHLRRVRVGRGVRADDQHARRATPNPQRARLRGVRARRVPRRIAASQPLADAIANDAVTARARRGSVGARPHERRRATARSQQGAWATPTRACASRRSRPRAASTRSPT